MGKEFSEGIGRNCISVKSDDSKSEGKEWLIEGNSW